MDLATAGLYIFVICSCASLLTLFVFRWYRRKQREREVVVNWLELPADVRQACQRFVDYVGSDAVLDGRGNKRQQDNHSYQWRLVVEVPPRTVPFGAWRVLSRKLVRMRVGVWTALIELKRGDWEGRLVVCNVDESWLFIDEGRDERFLATRDKLKELFARDEWTITKEFNTK
jgi:hypothetical protein